MLLYIPIHPASLRGAARDRHGLRGGMRWPRAVFDGRDARKGCSGLPGTSRAEQSDDRAVSRTAQIALSRRIALRHGAAPRPVLFGGGRGDQRPWSGGSLRLAHRGFYAKQAVKTIARGTPDVSGAFVATTSRVLSIFAHEAADASRVRRSVRPLDGGGGNANSLAPPRLKEQG